MAKKNLLTRSLVAFVLLLVVSLSFVAYANDEKIESSTTITDTQTGAWGSAKNYPGIIGNLSGSNSSSSIKTLYCATDLGPTYRTMAMVVGSGYCSQSGFTITPGTYRVLLDPAGPDLSGCNGQGSFWQYR